MTVAGLGDPGLWLQTEQTDHVQVANVADGSLATYEPNVEPGEWARLHVIV